MSDEPVIPPELRSFRGRRLPDKASLVGYTALIDHFDLDVPLPRQCFGIRKQGSMIDEDHWTLLTSRYQPAQDLEGHLTFALKYEGVDLSVLKRLFEVVESQDLEKIVTNKKTGIYTRKIWFFYEWLIGEKLEIPDATQGNYVPALDPEKQYALEDGERSRRHRVRNNLPGSPDFCPLVFRTEAINEFINMDLAEKAQDLVDDVPKDLLTRTASFLLLKDSQSSFEIENERPSRDRIQRWGQAIGEAGEKPLDKDELLRLQETVIGDPRFVDLGFRDKGGFVGEHDRRTRAPLPDHISARPEDLSSLIQGLLHFTQEENQRVDPVVAAAVTASGFVYIHPFEDGNGRIHRYLIHHILARRGFNPPGVVFPISSAILDRVDKYRTVLENYSKRLLPHIDWEETDDHNIRVLNNTRDFYRYFDATPHVEFLFECVRQTIEEDLPEEIEFLRHYDEFCNRVNQIVDMPDRTLNLLFNFLDQNQGTLSKRARNNEFEQLTESETKDIERKFNDLFSPEG